MEGTAATPATVPPVDAAQTHSWLNAVSGATAGALALAQRAYGGDGGRLLDPPGFPTGLGGSGGDATSVLEASNAGGGALDATVEAHGGIRPAEPRRRAGGRGRIRVRTGLRSGDVDRVSDSARVGSGGAGAGSSANGGSANALAAQESPIEGPLLVAAEASGGPSLGDDSGFPSRGAVMRRTVWRRRTERARAVSA